MTSMRPAEPSRDQPLSVHQVNSHLKRHIEKLGEVWIEGELMEWKLNRGNIYAKLRDLTENAALNLTQWRSKNAAEFQAGDRVVLKAAPSYWIAGGSLSFTIQTIEHVGVGKLLQQLAELRAKIFAEGLAAPERKKPLPFLPNLVGLITGKDSDAERDVLVNARKRWPGVQFKVIHSAVQGVNAVPELLDALTVLDADPAVDVIIFARGGGELEHLLPFSDEQLLRAVAAASTPIVSAIGHEPDTPLLDDVADARASTPTAAGKLVVPDVAEEISKIGVARERLYSGMLTRISRENQLLEQIRTRPALARPETLVVQQQEEIARWIDRAYELADRRILTATQDLAAARSSLRALSPFETLKRGYAVAQLADGTVLKDPAAAPAGTKIGLHLAAGKLQVTSD